MTLYDGLDMADRHIATAEKHIAEQRNRVLELRRRGEDDTLSQNLLATFIYGLPSTKHTARFCFAISTRPPATTAGLNGMLIKVFTTRGDERQFDETDIVGAVAYATKLAKTSPRGIAV